MIKAIFLDFDQTVFSHKQRKVPESAVKAINQAKANGVKIFLATGRHPLEIYSINKENIAYDGYVCLNGQLNVDQNNKLVSGYPLDTEASKNIADMYTTNHFPIVLGEKDRVILNHMEPIVKEAQTELSWPHPIEAYDGDTIYMASCFLNKDDQEYFRNLYSSCKVVQWHPLGIDILSKEGGKDIGVSDFMKLHNFTKDEIITVGDSGNDLDMMKFSNISIAMGNGKKEIKEAASYVTDDIDADGLYNAFKHYNLI